MMPAQLTEREKSIFERMISVFLDAYAEAYGSPCDTPESTELVEFMKDAAPKIVIELFTGERSEFMVVLGQMMLRGVEISPEDQADVVARVMEGL